MVFNARSIFNKSDNLRELLHQLAPDLSLISETFESESKQISTVIENANFKSISYYRKNRAPGGGCAIVYHETRFLVADLHVSTPDGVESCWALFTPKNTSNMKVKRIAVGSYYISPRSRYKHDTIEHIIATIHQLRAKYANDVNFVIGGDFNRVDLTDVLESYGALKQVITTPTRKDATLEAILTDLYTMYHPPPPPCYL